MALVESLPVRGAWVEIFCTAAIASARATSLPVRGAWVEIAGFGWFRFQPSSGSLPVRGAWVEIRERHVESPHLRGSLPVRGAWVEIMLGERWHFSNCVAPRAGSVG